MFAPGASTPSNLAVTHMAMDAPLAGVGFPARIELHVTNFGTGAVRGTTLRVAQDGRIVYQADLPSIEAGATHVDQGIVAFSEAGAWGLTATIQSTSDDALPADDHASLSVEARRAV